MTLDSCDNYIFVIAEVSSSRRLPPSWQTDVSIKVLPSTADSGNRLRSISGRFSLQFAPHDNAWLFPGSSRWYRPLTLYVVVSSISCRYYTARRVSWCLVERKSTRTSLPPDFLGA